MPGLLPSNAGMRGIEMEVYTEAERIVGSVDQLSRLNDSITVENAGKGSFRTIETAKWETPFEVTSDRNVGR